MGYLWHAACWEPDALKPSYGFEEARFLPPATGHAAKLRRSPGPLKELGTEDGWEHVDKLQIHVSSNQKEPAATPIIQGDA